MTERWVVPIRVWPFGLWFLLVGPLMLLVILPAILLLQLPMFASGSLILAAALVVARRSCPVLPATGVRLRIRSLLRTRSLEIPLSGTVGWSRFGTLLIILPQETICLWCASRTLSSYQYRYGYGRLRSVLDRSGLHSEVWATTMISTDAVVSRKVASCLADVTCRSRRRRISTQSYRVAVRQAAFVIRPAKNGTWISIGIGGTFKRQSQDIRASGTTRTSERTVRSLTALTTPQG